MVTDLRKSRRQKVKRFMYARFSEAQCRPFCLPGSVLPDVELVDAARELPEVCLY